MSPPTLYPILLSTSGLSQRAAAALHGVRPDTVKSWSAGRNRAPPGVLADLTALIRRQTIAARVLADALERLPPDTAAEIGLATSDAEAQALPLGWPTVSAQARVIGMAVALAGRPVVIVPRGSTPASAAAVEAHKA